MQMFARCRIASLLLCLLAASAIAADAPRVLDGFTIELVAGAEHVQHPMMACFDDVGRLYVCESAGTNRKAAELVADPQDSIKVLEDADGDGRYEKSWTFADKLVFPQGCLWYRGAIYTCSSPYLWKLEDTDGDGVCDRRTVLVKSFGFSGNAADIHGPFLSPDGRLYWCDGRHGHEIHDLGDGQIGGEDNVAGAKANPEPGLPNPDDGELLTKGKAARIFSCRPDGSDLRVLCGGGMDNPVEVDFWETGECLGTVNLFYGQPRGDCLVHWVEGGVYPREDQPECIAEFPWTGGLLGPVTNYGHVAVSGMCRYRSTEFGDLLSLPTKHHLPDHQSPASTFPTDRASFFVTQFNTHKVVQTIVERHGSTFRALETNDFLVSDNPDFHPTDVLEDADGSLLVVDTGGWFRIGCPTSQIAKPEIAGGIYRIRKTGSHQVEDPRGRLVDWNQIAGDFPALLALLGDPRPAVRERACEVAALVLNGDEERVIDFCQLANQDQATQRRLGFIDGAARAQRSLLAWHYIQSDPSTEIRLAALQGRPSTDPAVADEEVQHVIDAAFQRLNSAPAESRAAMEVLSALLCGESDTDGVVAALLHRLRQTDVDRTLEHAAIVALTRIKHQGEAARALNDEVPAVQRAALIALDQMEGGHLTRDEVLPLLATSDAALREAALDVISRRHGWAGETVSLFRDWLGKELKSDQSAVLQRFIAAQAGDPAIQTLVAEILSAADQPAPNRAALLEAVATADAAEWPAAWSPVLQSLLAGTDADLQLQALRIIGSRGLQDFDDAIRNLFNDDRQPTPVRIEALAVVGPRLSELSPADREFVSHTLQSDADLLLRLRLASAYAAAPLSEVHVCTAAGLTPKLGPAFVPALWHAYEQAATPGRQRHVVQMLSELKELPNVSERQLRELLSTYSTEAQTAAEPLLARFAAREAESLAKIDRYLPWAEGGDADRGRYVFFGQTAACAKCHRIGDQGAQIGPDLTKIGGIRQPRDLVESILLPSASFARDFHPWTAVTTEGQAISGLISRQSADAIVFRLTDLSEVRVRRAEIETLAESQTSIMPQGLETKLSEQEFRDLLAYLRSLR